MQGAESDEKGKQIKDIKSAIDNRIEELEKKGEN